MTTHDADEYLDERAAREEAEAAGLRLPRRDTRQRPPIRTEAEQAAAIRRGQERLLRAIAGK